VNDLHQFRRDGAENPGFHHAVHTYPIWIRGSVSVDLSQDVRGWSAHICHCQEY
jgi:hypothetical protein